MRRVKFQTGGSVEIPDLAMEADSVFQHEIARHIVRRAPRLKRGKWFVQVAADRAGGYIGFHGRDEQLHFKIV